MRPTTSAFSLVALVSLVAASSQLPLIPQIVEQELSTEATQLQGRFIHLTDMHPDTFYRYNSSESSACHGGGKDDDSEDRAGYWGTSVSDCDAPLTLINATFDWLEEHYKGKVDFVVWTGDNARHDIDTRFPRSLPEILRLNRYIASRMRKTFGKVPIVTSIGNNDIFPHNIMFAGPSTITNELLSVWKHFIPEVHLHSFARGGYYSIEAIPGQLLLISLNTLYFYENNKAVDGCPSFSKKARAFKKDDDPGTEELLWLEQQLLLARARGMQVWMTGHVPATKSNWYQGCYSRYGELVLSFHDTIVGHLFGHMNVDHFSFIQSHDVMPKKKKKGKGKRKGKKHLLPSSADSLSLDNSPVDSETSSLPFSTFGSTSTLVNNLFKQYENLPSEKKAKERDFNVVHINPSVIPTYLPAFRVWEYNTTIEGKWRQPPSLEMARGGNETMAFEWAEEEEEDQDDDKSSLSNLASFLEHLLPSSLSRPLFALLAPTSRFSPSKPITPLKKKKKRPNYPPLPRYSSKHSPSRSNAFLTPLGFTQYFLRLDDFNAHEGYGSAARLQKGGERPRPEWVVEYTTRPAEEVAERLQGAFDAEEDGELGLWPEEVVKAVKGGKGLKEVVKKLREEDVTPYEMKDLTLGRWLKLARRIAAGGREWKDYRKRMFVSSKGED
ncbi:Metallo-dependent phosphatase-like protein [Leucosporidium creatinivorum]|uniref:Endopolyphosphatase n=1 Tax=Leucosporidium creatinivorum TaxID=106004 RepID=A0A1Y2FHR0_9BASI|nr:Metallo-dependent phosphatase-like protein [Leucosporidium creatinivorum]